METKPDKAVSIIECDMNVSPPPFPHRKHLMNLFNNYIAIICCALFARWILMLLWVTKNLNDDLSTKKNQL